MNIERIVQHFTEKLDEAEENYKLLHKECKNALKRIENLEKHVKNLQKA